MPGSADKLQFFPILKIFILKFYSEGRWINIINSRILLSAASIAAAGALVIGATFAYFSDSGTSNDNVFATGTLILKLSDANETEQDNVIASFGGTNLKPGDSVTGQLNLKNTGTISANHAEVAVVNTNSDTTNPLDKVLEITTLNYDGLSVLSQVTDANTNGWIDLDDLKASGLDNLALTNLNTNHPLDLTVKFRSDAGDVYQGDNVDSDWTITLNQDVLQ